MAHSYYNMGQKYNKPVVSKRKRPMSKADKLKIAIGAGVAIPILLTIIK